ncbi:uncharacterized protein EDB93DRAFT_1242305 [Suillus bovinus]|uniref:uncharacterized protein n=1 Tax=Suillus bovinus TaxID=48563 RepID=UPI001B85C280|nr:uncharacterized protein EDB93DRAFT_1242305 [Suillus bovinus]KAG2136951.1 hypothetical protein EDB93DRAFT_1242305 [Suillus bovinus]
MAATLTKHHDTPPFADHKDLHNVIDATQLGDVPWQCFSVVPPWMDDEFEVWYRDPRAMAHNIIANPSYKDEIDYAPFCEYDASDNTRQWKDFMSRDWAWQQAVCLASDTISQDPETQGSTLVPIILSSDKTTVSVGTGNNEYYPLYASIGNVHNNMRRAHRDALVIIGFLAIPKTDRSHSKDDSFQIFRHQLFHSSLSAILSSLKPFMTTHEVVRCGDGPYIADYEEQLVLSCVVKHWCLKCIAVHTNLDGGGIYHSHEHIDFLINELHADILWDEFGLIGDLVPFTNDFPRADIHELLSFDLLHQLIKGAFKDHLVDWVAKYLKAVHGTKWSEEIMSDIDRRPRFQQWMGDDSKALMKVFLLAIEGHVPQDMVRAFHALLEFCYLIWCNVITEDTMIQIQDALYHFHHYRKIFDTVVPTFSLPPQHSMTHYVDMIRLFGTPNGLCSSITELKHIKAVKEPWRWSNRHNALGQMLVTNQRLDKLAASRVDFDAQTVAALAHEVAVFNSAATTFYAPSDLSGIGGMQHEHIRACPLWWNEYPRNDCMFINTDSDAEGMRGLKVARVICFFSFKHDWEVYPCTLIQWFEKIGDCPDENTGMWMTVFRAAHLIPIYGSEYIPPSLKFYQSLDTFSSFYVNKYADHHVFEIAS